MPFDSQEFRKFADNMGFKDRKIIPLWPRANAECERSINVLFGVEARHGMHDLQVFSTSFSIPGIYTFSRNSCFVLTIP
jgi:hypothetical protein